MATQLAHTPPSGQSVICLQAKSATAAVIRAIGEMTNDRLPSRASDDQPSAIMAAFAELREAYRLLFLLPDSADEADEQLLFERHDRARQVLANTTAITPREHAAKLRAALQGIDQGGQNALLLHGLTELMDEPANTQSLQEADFFRDMVWSTIVDLERPAARL